MDDCERLVIRASRHARFGHLAAWGILGSVIAWDLVCTIIMVVLKAGFDDADTVYKIPVESILVFTLAILVRASWNIKIYGYSKLCSATATNLHTCVEPTTWIRVVGIMFETLETTYRISV